MENSFPECTHPHTHQTLGFETVKQEWSSIFEMNKGEILLGHQEGKEYFHKD